MNSSSALQPKQVIWLPQPQIKLVWFNFRFGLLLQPYIKGDIFHYTAKLQASRQRWSTPTPPAPTTTTTTTLAVGRYHGSIMAFIRCCCSSRKAGGAMGATALACYPLGSGTSVPTAYLDGCVAKPWQYATIHQLSIVSDGKLTHGGNLRHPCTVSSTYMVEPQPCKQERII